MAKRKKQYVLRTCNADGTSHNGFKWPKRGKVVAPDWEPSPQCGGGLHGALWGLGEGKLFDWSSDARWQVVRIDGDMVDLGGKVKFGKGYVVYTGTRLGATEYIKARGATDPIIGSTSVAGDHDTSISGFRGTSISGTNGTSKSGDGGTSKSGDGGTSISGYFGTSISGYGGTSKSGYFGTSTSGAGGVSISGYFGTSISGYGGTSKSGDGGTSKSGDGGTSTSGAGGVSISGDNGRSITGYLGTATTGINGVAKAGHGGVIVIWYKDGKTNQPKVGYVGKDGIKPDTFYKLVNGEFVEVDE